MIKLRLEPPQQSPHAPNVMCIVVGDSSLGLSIDAHVHLDRLPDVSGATNMYRLRWGAREQLVREVGDADAQARLFERI